MPLSVAAIQAPIASEMQLFERKFRDLMKSDVMLLDQIMNYIVKRKGKQLRPMFVFLSAGVCGQISEATYRGAALIELLHTATLVHEMQRREGVRYGLAAMCVGVGQGVAVIYEKM